MSETSAGAQKAAVLLLSLGPDAASEVLRHLRPDEIREVARALACTSDVQPEELGRVQEEFRERLAGAGGLVVDGGVFAKAIVTKAFQDGSAAAVRAEILGELESLPAGEAADLSRVLEGVPPEGLAKLLEEEHPQVATLLVAHLEPGQASAVIGHLPEALQTDVVERLARMQTTVSPRVLAQVGSIFSGQLKGLQRRKRGRRLGGPKAVAEIMNHAQKAVERRIFEEIEQRDPELATTIRSMMFTFEDCLKLDNRAMQTLLKDVAREDLLLALKTASPELSEKVFANVSSRAAQILRDDMAAAPPARLKDVEEAQLKIVATLRELEAEGKIVVAGAGQDEALV